MEILNGKITYLVKTTDLVNSKVNQVINSLRLMAGAFSAWHKQLNSLAKLDTCHFNMQQEFLSLFSMEVNSALISLLRLTEVDDLIRQITHLNNRNLVGFADFPRFLTEELTLKLSTQPILTPAIDALRNGLSIMMKPLVDIKFPSSRKLQLHLLFMLPVLKTANEICTIEQLIPITYRADGSCYGGPMPRHDLRLLTCNNKRYILKQNELAHCAQSRETLLCPRDLLTTVESTDWLGPQWSPQSRLTYDHVHIPLANCNNLRTMLHLGGRIYLATDKQTLPIDGRNGTFLLTVFPLHVYHFPCDYSFHSQSTGLANCPKKLTFQFPLFHNGLFHFIPWQTVRTFNSTLMPDPNFSIPKMLKIENTTLVSLNRVYNSLDQDFTRHLAKLNSDINSVKEVPRDGLFSVLLYISFALAICNLLLSIFFYCIFSKRISTGNSRSSPQLGEVHSVPQTRSVSTSI